MHKNNSADKINAFLCILAPVCFIVIGEILSTLGLWDFPNSLLLGTVLWFLTGMGYLEYRKYHRSSGEALEIAERQVNIRKEYVDRYGGVLGLEIENILRIVEQYKENPDLLPKADKDYLIEAVEADRVSLVYELKKISIKNAEEQDDGVLIFKTVQMAITFFIVFGFLLWAFYDMYQEFCYATVVEIDFCKLSHKYKG